jgi:putative spermidine/putrescine transport system permease protein
VPAGYLVVAFMIPLAWLLLVSFYTPIPTGFYAPAFTSANYTRFVFDPFYLRVLGRTLALGGLAAVGALGVGYPLALVIAFSPSTVRAVLLGAVLSPVLVSIVVRTYGWMVILAGEGPLNQALVGLGVLNTPLRFLSQPLGVLIGLVSAGLPYMVLSLLGPLQNIRTSLIEAAHTLGATDAQVLRLVIVPLSMPGVITGLALVYVLSAAAFVTPFLLGGGRVLTVPLLVYEQGVRLLNWPFAAAAAFVLLAGSIVVLVGGTWLTRTQAAPI